jgi:hypothetical protein
VSGVQESTGTPIGASNNFADFSGFMVPGALPALVISEINYDSPLNDALEFIEIHNPGTTPVPLSNSIHLLLVDGSSTASPRAEYERYTLESVTDANGMSVTSLPAGGYVVAASATFFQQVPLPSGTLRLVINRSSSFDTDIIQNGLGDGAGLVNMDTGTLIDSVLYEGVTQQGSVFDVTTHPGRRELDFAEGTPTALSGNADLGFRFDSLQRFPHGRDTNDNNTDFVYVLKATPGGPL